MSKVVYLLGAGASFGTRENGIGSPILTGLPIVREIECELENMINLLASIPLNDKELEESKQMLIKGFLKLKDACSDNATIDTYAKNYGYKERRMNLLRSNCCLRFSLFLNRLFINQTRDMIHFMPAYYKGRSSVLIS